jgi:hypothetical protein
MKIAEDILLPAVRVAHPDSLICAPGTSCRHQIHDGARRESLHPATIIKRGLKITGRTSNSL